MCGIDINNINALGQVGNNFPQYISAKWIVEEDTKRFFGENIFGSIAGNHLGTGAVTFGNPREFAGKFYSDDAMEAHLFSENQRSTFAATKINKCAGLVDSPQRLDECCGINSLVMHSIMPKAESGHGSGGSDSVNPIEIIYGRKDFLA